MMKPFSDGEERKKRETEIGTKVEKLYQKEKLEWV